MWITELSSGFYIHPEDSDFHLAFLPKSFGWNRLLVEDVIHQLDLGIPAFEAKQIRQGKKEK